MHKFVNGEAAEIYGKIPSAWTVEKAIEINYADEVDRQWVNSKIIKKTNIHTVATQKLQHSLSSFILLQNK